MKPTVQAKEWSELNKFLEDMNPEAAREMGRVDVKIIALKSFISSILAEARKERDDTAYAKGIIKGKEQAYKEIEGNIGMLRQWLNEDRITDPNKMVASADIKRWLFLDILSVLKEKE